MESQSQSLVLMLNSGSDAPPQLLPLLAAYVGQGAASDPLDGPLAYSSCISIYTVASQVRALTGRCCYAHTL